MSIEVSQPLAHLGMFVGRIIIDDGMDHFAGWSLLLDGIEEANKLLMAVALHVAARAANLAALQWLGYIGK